MSAQGTGGLEAELARPPAWMYPWNLGEAGTPPLLGPELPSVHQTRLELMEAPVRAALAAAGEGATAIDLACSEGWFAHRLLEWGASRVVGVDLRAQSIERARLVRDHLGVPEERLALIESDIFDLDLEALGQFDVVLVLALVDHVEDPAGALRRAYRVARRVCVVETQLTRQREPVTHGCGAAGLFDQAPASFAALLEHDAGENPIASDEGVMAMIPNRAAAELAVRAAGFGRTEWQEPASNHNAQYRLGDRGLLAAWHVPQSRDPVNGRATWLDFPGVTGRIHLNDDILYPQDPFAEHYARTGRSALKCIEAALAEAGRGFADVGSCLDLACGYGRVLRLLRERIPCERITACDVTAEAVAFCAYEFGARPLLSDPEFEGVPFETYDLVWVGSLVTHLDERLLSKFVGLLPRLLAPGGVLLITTLGEFGIQDVSRYESRLASMQGPLEADFRRRGFAFVPYEGRTEGLGYAWHSPEFLVEAVETASGGYLQRQAAWPRGWDDHQDVIVFATS